MSEKTSIEWTATVNPDGSVTPGATWNPTRGCSRVSPGCVNCYAERTAMRQIHTGYKGLVHIANGHPAWTGKVVMAPESTLQAPLRWRKPKRIFVNSMSDLFHESLPDEAIDRVFAVMALCPQHTFQVLTKRPERMLQWALGKRGHLSCEFQQNPARSASAIMPLSNVWLGVSVENQKTADERIPLLLKTPAAVRFVSYEPALGPVDFTHYLDGHEDHGVDLSRSAGSRVGCCTSWTPPLDWIICGAESGPGARPFDEYWARATRDACISSDVAFFYKQKALNGHKITTPELDGERWMEFPE